MIDLPTAPEAVNRALLQSKIVGGLPLGTYYPELPNAMLVAVTETKTRDDIDRFVSAVYEAFAN